jgi:hypothetical protein
MKQASQMTCIAALWLCAAIAGAQVREGNSKTPDAPLPTSPVKVRLVVPRSLSTAPSVVARPPDAPVGQLGLNGKFDFYVEAVFAPANFVFPAIGASYRMANPIDGYPHQWRDGGGAFGRNYGDIVARGLSAKTTAFATGVVLREDPRYFPSEDRRPAARVFHAIKFTLIDKGDSDHDRVAFSNLAGSAAAGFVGNAYLPPGYRDATHAGQRSLYALAGFGIANELSEFRPEIRLALKKAHLPFVK